VIATFAGFSCVESGKCLRYTGLSGQGNGACPAKTTGFSSSPLLLGPTPANGATLTNLYAELGAALNGNEDAVRRERLGLGRGRRQRRGEG